ncbi:MAG: glycosyltransferase family 25 protein [Luteolibacter sp.]|uniref:glycosyltransferase family 25 protein n=1 Tax=Luteolibacter sp. TaxID=1962973 RepID=UPI003267E302
MNTHHWKLFVISLRRARKRRLQVLKQLANVDLPFEIVDAFDARQVRPELLVRGVNPNPLADGEVAAYHSHIGIMERIDDYGLDYGLVLEDDFVFGDAANLTLNNIWDQLPDDADHIQLHDIGNHFTPSYRVEERGEVFNKLAVTNVLTIGYIISRKLAKHILRCHRLPRMPFDVQLIEISRQGIFDFYDINERLIDGDWSMPADIDRTVISAK